MTDNIHECLESAIAAGIRPDPLLTVAEWAESNRVLPSETSAASGAWRNSRTPYLVEIMEKLSTVAREEEIVFMKAAQVGGPLWIETPIPTPNGWTTMGSLSPGDIVYAQSGEQAAVVGVSPIFYGNSCFRVVFSDGTHVDCDAGHLWTLDVAGTLPKTISTIEIAKSFQNSRGRNIYSIANCCPIQNEAKDLPLDPYVLGVWLGDGAAKSNRITTHESDAEFLKLQFENIGHEVYIADRWSKGLATELVVDPVRKIKQMCRRGHIYKISGQYIGENGKKYCAECARQASKKCQYGFVPDPIIGQRFGEIISQIGVKGNKHIPSLYLRSSVDQRLSLLQGLMDTDGHATNRGRCEFSNGNYKLISAVSELLYSLGISHSIKKRKSASGFAKKESTWWRISFTTYRDNLPCFRLPRKLNRLAEYSNGRPYQTRRRYITDVMPIESLPVRCIQVATHDNLFLCGKQMVATHNTEAGINWLDYIIDISPGPTLAIQPTVETAKSWSKSRLMPSIELSPRLRAKIPVTKSKDPDNTVFEKKFPGGALYITGANSAVGLRSKPIRNLFMDEVDGYPHDVDGEGDPTELAKARTRTFSRRKIFYNSTPTIEGRSRIHSEFLRTGQRRYHVPCPHCGAFDHLRFGNLKWEPGEPESAAMLCESCGALIEERHKPEMLQAGRWVPEFPHLETGKRVGYHINSLYSPYGWYSWANVAEDFQKAKKDVRKLRVFVNTVLGEPFRERGDAPEWRRLFDRRESYRRNVVPAGAALLTAGVDVQPDRLECEIVAWGPGLENWSVDYRVIPGDIETDAPWLELEKLFSESVPHESGGSLMVRLLGIDSGYATATVYKWVRKFGAGRCLATKGMPHLQTIVGQPKRAEVSRSGRRINAGIKLWGIGTDMAKSELYGWLRLDGPTKPGEPFPSGFCHFPEYDDEYFKMLTAEELKSKVSKGYTKYEWEKIRDRNEALDIRIIARAMAYITGADRWTAKNWDGLFESISETAPRNDKEKHDPSGAVGPRERTANDFFHGRKHGRDFWE